MLSPSDMTDKSAMVTGAAAGLGRATALLLAEAGANLCLVDIDAKGLAGTAANIRALGREVLVKAVNLAEGSQCHAVVTDTVSDFGRLDALCNVAAVFMPTHTTDMTDEQWSTCINPSVLMRWRRAG